MVLPHQLKPPSVLQRVMNAEELRVCDFSMLHFMIFQLGGWIWNAFVLFSNTIEKAAESSSFESIAWIMHYYKMYSVYSILLLESRRCSGDYYCFDNEFPKKRLGWSIHDSMTIMRKRSNCHFRTNVLCNRAVSEERRGVLTRVGNLQEYWWPPNLIFFSSSRGQFVVSCQS